MTLHHAAVSFPSHSDSGTEESVHDYDDDDERHTETRLESFNKLYFIVFYCVHDFHLWNNFKMGYKAH